MNYWLMKSEPDAFGLNDLQSAPEKTTGWDGVRNYQARNFMRDDMKRGDRVFLYHSSCAEPGIVAIMRVVREAYPDPTAFKRRDPHFDPKSDPENPRWFQVDVKLVRPLKRLISLKELKEQPASKLKDFPLLRRGNRLSIMPVEATHWQFIMTLEKKRVVES